MTRALLLIALFALLPGCSAKRSAVRSEASETRSASSEVRRDSTFRSYVSDSSYCDTEDVEYVRTVYRPDTAISGHQLIDYTIKVSKASRRKGNASSAAVSSTASHVTAKSDSVSHSESFTEVRDEASGGCPSGWPWWLLLAVLLFAAAVYARYRLFR